MKTFDNALRFVFTLALCWLVGTLPALSQAALLPNAKQTFLDADGNPLSGGQVFMYVPNTQNKKSTWSNSTQTILNTNPVVLDAAGTAQIYGQGSYQQRVLDADGNEIWNAPTTAYGSSAPTGATGTDTAPIGSILPWSSFTLPTNWLYAYGQALNRADYPDLLTALTITDTSVSCSSGSPTLSGWDDTSQMKVGAAVEASCVTTGTTIIRINSATAITVSNNASATAVVTGVVFPWGNGNGTSTFNVPDLRGRVIAAPDAMGGTSANRLQVATTITTVSGNPDITVVSATGISTGMVITSLNVPLGTTVSSINGTTVTMSANASASAAGTATVFSAFQSANAPGSSGGNENASIARTNLPAVNLTTTIPAGEGSHTHLVDISNAAGGVGASIAPGNGTNISSKAVSTVTLPQMAGTTPTGGNNAPLLVVQPTISVNYIIKVRANTTGLGGVVSIGGMFGDIACDATFLCAPSGSPSVNYIGLATQADLTLLGNVSGGTAQPVPLTNTQWLNATIGSTQGMLILRGASTWGALAIGAADTFLKSNGTTAAWSALPIASSSILGVVQGDGATLPITGPGVISCRTATSALIGCSRPDGVTITAVAGTLTAIGGATTSIGVGITSIAGGTTTRVLFDNAGLLGEYSISGSGNVAMTTSPTFVTPVLGAATATSINGLTITSSTGTLTVTNGKTASFTNTNTWTGTDAAVYTFPAASATIPRLIASGTAALGTSAISSAACATVVTVSATGVATTDVVDFGFNGDPTAVTGYVPLTTGMLTIIPYPTANNVNVKVCNNTGSSITPGAITLNWKVLRQ